MVGLVSPAGPNLAENRTGEATWKEPHDVPIGQAPHMTPIERERAVRVSPWPRDGIYTGSSGVANGWTFSPGRSTSST